MKYLSRLISAICAACLTTPAFALSCVPPDPAHSFVEADQAEAVYVVVYGKLSFDPSKSPVVDLEQQQAAPKDTEISARLTGKSLSPVGFEAPFDHDITLNIKCFGPWCGEAVQDVPYLAFVEQQDAGYRLIVEPCARWAFPEPDADALKKVQQCMQGESCEAG